jgi:hypothetical protein
MYCPRCGAENSDDRASCWNCFAQLRQSADVKGRKTEPKPSKADRKKGKGEPVPEPAVAPVIPELAPEEIPQAAVEEPVAHAPLVTPPPAETPADEVDTSPVARESVPVPLDVLQVIPVPETPSAPEPEAGPAQPEESTFVAGIPLGPSTEETEPGPEQDASEESKVLDLDAPVEDVPYVIPGLAETESEEEIEDQPSADDGKVLDLDSEVPDDVKPEDKA